MNLNLNNTTFREIKDIEVPDSFRNRVITGLVEFDQFLGGGWVPGATWSLHGKAGIGKSRLVRQTLQAASEQGYKVGIVSAEESVEQIAYSCEGMNVSNVEIANMSDVDNICAAMISFDILVIDSFQCLTTKHKLNSRKHEKYCIETIVDHAKLHNCVTGIILHVTKGGIMKGGSGVPHTVDTTMVISSDKENPNLKNLTMEKNRFGPVGEIQCESIAKGFSFTQNLENTETSEIEGKREILHRKVLSLSKTAITIHDIMPFVGNNVHTALILLRELVLSQKVFKTGRGNNAIYQKT